MNNFPQVLLVGNGLNICNGSETWGQFLASLVEGDGCKWLNCKTLPMTLQAILISNNKLQEKLKIKAKSLLPNKSLCDSKISLSSLLSIGFDEVLTTNYTYELEQACLNNQTISLKKLTDMHIYNVDSKNKPEPKYLIQTCNKSSFNGKDCRIWHIHGEARKPNGMILGHYYYGQLVSRIIDYLSKKGNSYTWSQNNNQEVKIKSWIDAFILGDVYILGQGFNTAEIDLWWLLNRKRTENARHGQVYFFEPFKESEQEKIALLKCFDVKVEDFGIKQKIVDDKDCTDYVDFYNKAIKKIQEIVLNNR